MSEDLYIARLKGNSNSLWTISPPSRKSLINMLGSDEEFLITVSWAVQRYATTKRYQIVFIISDGGELSQATPKKGNIYVSCSMYYVIYIIIKQFEPCRHSYLLLPCRAKHLDYGDYKH